MVQAPMDSDMAENTSANGIPVYSGGVAEELDYIRSIEHQYDLKVLFTETSGAFLADLPVIIKNKAGAVVLSTVTKGPILLVDLPKGTYNLVASSGGESKEQKISVTPHSTKKYHMVFTPPTGETTQNND